MLQHLAEHLNGLLIGISAGIELRIPGFWVPSKAKQRQHCGPVGQIILLNDT